MTFGVEKLEWFDYPTVKKNDYMFIRFDRIHESDRQTDGRTPPDGNATQAGHIGRACIASSGKKSALEVWYGIVEFEVPLDTL